MFFEIASCRALRCIVYPALFFGVVIRPSAATLEADTLDSLISQVNSFCAGNRPLLSGSVEVQIEVRGILKRLLGRGEIGSSAKIEEYAGVLQQDLANELKNVRTCELGVFQTLVKNLVVVSRIFAGPSQYPPESFGAYGILAFRSRATKMDVARHKMLCAAYVASQPHTYELASVPTKRQMVTVWPMEKDPIADKVNTLARSKVCELAVEHYGLLTAAQALKDAQVGGETLQGRGPFLLAWSPATSKGRDNTLILSANLSEVTNFEQALEVMQLWAKEIENPELWQDGWRVEKLRLAIRHWVDRVGPKIFDLIRK